MHQWHLRNTWQQALSLPHLQICGLRLDETEVRRIHILAIGHGLERGGGGNTVANTASCGKLRKRFVTEVPRKYSIFLAGSHIRGKIIAV